MVNTMPGVDYVGAGTAASSILTAVCTCPAPRVSTLRALSFHLLCVVLQVPDTPEDDSALAAVAAAGEAGCGDLLKQALRRSAEKGRAATSAQQQEQQPQQEQQAAAARPDVSTAAQAQASPPSSPFTRDLTNHQLPAAASLRQQGGATAQPAPHCQKLGAALHARGATPGLPQQQQQQWQQRQHHSVGQAATHMPLIGAASEPIPLAQQQQQQQRQQPRASFLAGAKAALQEASGPGSQTVHASPRPTAKQPHPPARAGQVPQLALRRSPLALAALPAAPGSALAGQVAAPLAAPGLTDRTPQGQLGLRRTPGTLQAPPTGTTDGGVSAVSGGAAGAACWKPQLAQAGLLGYARHPPNHCSRASHTLPVCADVDSDFLNRIASLERKHAVAHTSSDPQQQQQQQQQVLPVVQHAALGQQQLQQPPVAPGHQPLLQQQPAQGSVPELQVHELAPAEPPAAPVVLPAPPSDGPLKSGWSDTPDSACLAMMDCLEQQAADRLAGAAAGGAGTADGSPVPARQLSFTPTGHGVRAAGAGAAPGSTPLSSGGRPSNLPTSHLGRSALQQAAAAAVAGLQQEGQPALVQAVEQEQQVLVPEQQPVAPALHQHAPPMAQQQQPLAKLAESGQKRSLAASIALEQLAAQHSPAAAARQQKEQPHAGLPPTDQGHASKRLRVGGSQPATQAPLPYAQQQQQQQQQQQNPQAVAAAGGQPPLSAPAPSHAAGPTAVAMEDAAATFDYREQRSSWCCAHRWMRGAGCAAPAFIVRCAPRLLDLR